jgi:Recombination endonuclease VII
MPYKDPQKQQEYQERWKANHPEKIRAYGQESEKRETTKETRKQYRQSEAGKASMSRRQKKYRQAHPDTAASWPSQTREAKHDRYYRHEHGITLVEFEARMATQNNLCPIGNHPFGERGKKNDSPCQDHDHETGENRLILCRRHNVGIGYFNESIAELESAILYLQSFKKTTGELPCPTLLPSAGKSQEPSN